ncbi:serine/threonine protein kinase [Pelagirhabdus alkalitolerans]|uniref:Serine/threonine protein kinase n=1 Tax=Pelagirhabdus alkalitolerans TaxID=1612202 RepID=A0A1G6MH47_9BACI|nr:protein kinase family protein [Pelagirhabdus alkalitolerans]SDC54800.1 serine/threonine protein kinase [Pelagirhabdus alkalitolerans]
MKRQKSHSISVYNLTPGTQIVGYWHQQTFTIIKPLGVGTVGAVYLVKRQDQALLALKISDNSLSITSEINVLKKLSKVRGNRLGPCLYDRDDWRINSINCYSFYTMSYIKGRSFNEAVRNASVNVLFTLISQLLDQVEHLHKAGFVLGDVKVENVMVSDDLKNISFVDVGGITMMGRSIKEYTEFYDRGYWQMGTRYAEVSYDLFSIAMLALHGIYQKPFKRQEKPSAQLSKKMNQNPALKPYRTCMEKALHGRYTSAKKMKEDLNLITAPSRKRTRSNTHVPSIAHTSIGELIILAVGSVVLFIVATFY